MPRVLDDRELHAEADAEIRDACSRARSGSPRSCLRRRACRSRRAPGSRPCSASDSTPSRFDLFRVDVMDVDLASALDAGVDERLGQRLVRLGQVDVLADHGDVALRAADARAHRRALPDRRGPRAAASMPSFLHTMTSRPFGVQHAGNLVDRVGVQRRNHGIRRDVGEERDLAASPSGIGRSARHSTMSGWMPISRSSFTECCVGLVFISPAAGMNGTSVRWM